MRRVIALSFISAVLAGCASSAPVSKPCGVIIDALVDVRGKTPADDRRIDIHHQRGAAAGCWDRNGVLPR